MNMPEGWPTEDMIEAGERIDPNEHAAKGSWVQAVLEAALAAAPTAPALQLKAFDAGILNTFGGGDRDWWLDYIRGLLSDAYAHYQEQVTTTPPAPEVEPVAWMHNEKTRFDVARSDAKTISLNISPKRMGNYTIPLYTHPADDSRGTDDELVHAVMTAQIANEGLRKAAEDAYVHMSTCGALGEAEYERALQNLRAELKKDKL